MTKKPAKSPASTEEVVFWEFDPASPMRGIDNRVEDLTPPLPPKTGEPLIVNVSQFHGGEIRGLQKVDVFKNSAQRARDGKKQNQEHAQPVRDQIVKEELIRSPRNTQKALSAINTRLVKGGLKAIGRTTLYRLKKELG